MAQLKEFGRVAGALIILLKPALFFRLEARGHDLPGLKPQQIELLGISLFINDQRGLLGRHCSVAAEKSQPQETRLAELQKEYKELETKTAAAKAALTQTIEVLAFDVQL